MPDRQMTPLLELDPDLGQLIGDDDRRAAAGRDLRVAVHVLQAGPWDVGDMTVASPEHLGLLILDGVLASEVLVSDTISTELLGPGDVVRPWRLHDASALLKHSIRWTALSRTRFALLDRRFAVELGRYPEVNAAILDRVNERALRLAVTQAISQMNRVDRRLLALFWHLAERWGRITPDGVAVPMTLSHRMLGQLVGARRPTVSTALGTLAHEGELSRREDGTWLLTGAPVGVPAPEIERLVPIRRRLLPPEPPAQARPAVVAVPAAPHEDLEPVHVRGVELHPVLDRLREQAATYVEEMRETYDTVARLTQRAEQLRDQCRRTRSEARGRPANGRSAVGG
jgi:CRP/FNR family transcriptional regulator, cyclic AMP receptor protein